MRIPRRPGLAGDADWSIGLRQPEQPIPERVDVVVVGGGAIGLATARELSVGGAHVAVVERGRFGLGSSYGNGGLVPPSHSIPLAAPGTVVKALRWMLSPESPFYVRPRADLSLIAFFVRFAISSRTDAMRRAVPAMRDLNRLSTERLAEVIADIGDVAYRQTGVINVYRSQAGFAAGRREAALLGEFGLPSRVFDAEQLRAEEPLLSGPLSGGVLWPEDGALDPVALTTALTSALRRRRDVALVEGVDVQEVRDDGSSVRVRTSAGTIAAGSVVVAAGSWSTRLLGPLARGIPLQPAKGYSITVNEPSQALRRPLLLSEAKVAVTPLDGRLRLAGTLELTGFDARIDRRRANAVMRAGRGYLADPAVTGQGVQAWTGLRALSGDGVPIVGRLPRTPRVAIATGHGHVGIGMTAGTAQLLAAIVLGESAPIDARPYDPARFAAAPWR